MDLSCIVEDLSTMGLSIPESKVEIDFTKSSDLRFPFCPSDDSGSIAYGNFLVSDSMKIYDKMEKISYEEIKSLGYIVPDEENILLRFLKKKEKMLYRVFDSKEHYGKNPLKMGTYCLGYYLKYIRYSRQIVLYVNRHTEVCKELSRVSNGKYDRTLNRLVSKAIFKDDEAVEMLSILSKYSIFIPVCIVEDDGVILNEKKGKDAVSSYGKNILESEKVISLLLESKVKPESFKILPGKWYFVYVDKGMGSVYVKRDVEKSPRYGGK